MHKEKHQESCYVKILPLLPVSINCASAEPYGES